MKLSQKSILDAIAAHLADLTLNFDIGSVSVEVSDNNGLHIQLGLKPKA